MPFSIPCCRRETDPKPRGRRHQPRVGSSDSRIVLATEPSHDCQITVVVSAFVPGHSGGTATDSHRLPHTRSALSVAPSNRSFNRVIRPARPERYRLFENPKSEFRTRRRLRRRIMPHPEEEAMSHPQATVRRVGRRPTANSKSEIRNSKSAAIRSPSVEPWWRRRFPERRRCRQSPLRRPTPRTPR